MIMIHDSDTNDKTQDTVVHCGGNHGSFGFKASNRFRNHVVDAVPKRTSPKIEQRIAR